MSTQTLSNPRVHLHWVRETPSRALHLPFSTSLETLDSLPLSVQTAVRDSGLNTVELHLPPYRPSHHGGIGEYAAGLQFRQDAAGRLIATRPDDPDPLATMAYHQAIVLMLRAISGDPTPLTITAESPRSPLLRRPLARWHRCAGEGALAKAPAERSAGYNRAYKAVSTSVQAAIRESLLPAHFTELEQFAERQHAHALLTWSAAAPTVGRHVDEIGVEVLNPQSVNNAFRGLTRNLATRLEEVREILVRHRANPVEYAHYNAGKAAKIATACRKRPRFMNQLFANERRLISSFVGMCARIPEWREKAAGNPAAVFRQVRDSWEDLEVQCRGFYQRRPHSFLGSILLVEAVRVLEAVDLEN